MIVVMVDKMLKTQIVECMTVVKWIFSDTMRYEFNSFYVWEIMHATLKRMGKQVEKLRAEYEQLEEKHKKSSLDPDSVQSEITDKELEYKLESLNTMRTQQKELFFTLIERFVDKLTQHLTQPSVKIEEGEELKMLGDSPYFFKWASERFEDILLTVGCSKTTVKSVNQERLFAPASKLLTVLVVKKKWNQLISNHFKHNEDILPYFEEIKSQFLTAKTHKSIVKVFKMFSTFKKWIESNEIFFFIFIKAQKFC